MGVAARVRFGEHWAFLPFKANFGDTANRGRIFAGGRARPQMNANEQTTSFCLLRGGVQRRFRRLLGPGFPGFFSSISGGVKNSLVLHVSRVAGALRARVRESR